MPLDVIYGESRNRGAAQTLATQLRAVVAEGTVYLGYPVLATADERVEVDALLVSREHGLVAFLLADDLPNDEEGWLRVMAEQDRLYAVLSSHLSRHEALRSGRTLAVEPGTATVFPAPVHGRPDGGPGFYGRLEDVAAWVGQLPPIEELVERNLNAALQRVTTIKPPKKRADVADPTSRGAKLKEIERGIANLDRWQKAAAIESPEGPQRIRGLAGSGKTVVLALKAAYLHSQHPDWRIVVTFQSRALYQQIADLVSRFTFEHIADKPDPKHLQILHSWGSHAHAGVYSVLAEALGETPRDWTYARGKYGQDAAFEGVCRELLEVAASRPVEPIFDAVLIDEAQDLPPEFFQLVYQFTKAPKRVVFGYDELQKLSDAVMPTIEELFGTGPNGEPLLSLASGPDEPKRDVVLRVCYRNTPWALATAHALGIGVYREGGLLQHPDEPTLWRDIGYNVVAGELAPGQHVVLERSRESYPAYFPQLLRADDAVVVRSFADELEHDSWIADQIAENLSTDELDPDDILVVLPDTYRAKSRAPRLMRELSRRGIDSHLVGVDTSVDAVFKPDSVALAHIYRAKGNEAPMVYAVDSQNGVSDINAVTRRNTLFTAITRSRAWVRISGWGPQMDIVAAEANAVIDRDFRLEFPVPTADELERLRHIHRELTAGQEATIRRAAEQLDSILTALERGDVDLADLPPGIRTRLTLLRTKPPHDDG
jgi:superfamily I DNA and RNA helicase